MIKYLDNQGVTKIGEQIKANKTAIDDTTQTVSTLNEKLNGLETDLNLFASEVREALEEGYNGAA